MTDLLPATPPATQLASLPKSTLGPAAVLARLQADKMLELPCGRRVWWFMRKGEGSLRDRSTPRNCAMITLMPDRKTFMLGYYPNEDSDRQVVDNLPIDRLADAANDLIGAGFGPRQPAGLAIPPQPLLAG